jgi:hypothetical protein
MRRAIVSAGAVLVVLGTGLAAAIHVQQGAPAPADDPLDRTVPSFNVTNEPIGAVVNRVAWLLGSSASGGGSRYYPPGAAELAPISVSIPHPATIREVLDAICRAQGSIAWTATGSRTGSGLSLSLRGNGFHIEESWLGDPVAPAPRTPAGEAAPSTRLSGRDIGDLVRQFALRAHVQLGAEISVLDETPPGSGPPMLGTTVTTFPALEGVRAILGLDSRYEASESHGIIHVALASDQPRRVTLLGGSIGPFRADDEPAGLVLERILWRLGLQPGGAGRRIRDDSAELARVSFSLQAGATAREALDALCRAQGAFSWIFRETGFNGGQFSVELIGAPGWPINRLVNVPIDLLNFPAARRASAPTVSLPSSLERTIARVQVSVNSSDTWFEFARLTGVPMGLELAPGPPASADRRVIAASSAPIPLLLGPGPLSEALSVLVERVSGYRIDAADGVVDVTPVGAPDFLDVPIDHFEVHDVPIVTALRQLRHAMNPQVPDTGGATAMRVTHTTGPDGTVTSQGPTMSAGAATVFATPLSLVAEHATPRQILNRLVALHGRVFWMASYEGSPRSVAAARVDTDCTIFIATFVGVDTALGIAPARPAIPFAPRTGGPGNARLRIAIPSDSRRLIASVQQLAAALRLPVGIEVVTPPGGAGSPAAVGTYDFSGLSIDESLDKVVAFVPGYAWRLNGRVYHVFPNRAPGATTTALDRPVHGLHDVVGSSATVIEALFRWLDLPPRSHPPGAPQQPNTLATFDGKSVAVDVANGTVRDALDALILSAGTLSWSAAYVDDSGQVSGVTIGLRDVNRGLLQVQLPRHP